MNSTMQLKLVRNTFSAYSTIGEMFLDGAHQCYTLEPAVKTDGSKPRAVPEGTYAVTIRESPRFKRDMPHIENVPGFEGVLIHWGNYPKDTAACILVGDTIDKQPNVIDMSMSAFNKLFPLLNGASSISITISSASDSQRDDEKLLAGA